MGANICAYCTRRLEAQDTILCPRCALDQVAGKLQGYLHNLHNTAFPEARDARIVELRAEMRSLAADPRAFLGEFCEIRGCPLDAGTITADGEFRCLNHKED